MCSVISLKHFHLAISQKRLIKYIHFRFVLKFFVCSFELLGEFLSYVLMSYNYGALALTSHDFDYFSIFDFYNVDVKSYRYVSHLKFLEKYRCRYPYYHCAKKKKKWSFLLRVSSVAVTKSAHFYTLWKYQKIREHRSVRIWSHLPKKCLMENFIFCAVNSM